AVRHVSSRIRRLIARTASSALPKSPSVPVRSTNASSTDTGSTSGEKSASMPMTCTETARYFAMSTGRKAAWAQSLAARAIGIAAVDVIAVHGARERLVLELLPDRRRLEPGDGATGAHERHRVDETRQLVARVQGPVEE